MATIPQIDDPTLDPQLAAYYRQIDELTGLALRGDVDERTFMQEMERIVTAVLRTAFLLAGGDLGNEAALNRLDSELEQQRQSIEILAGDIYDGRYSPRSEDDAAPGLPPQTAVEGREKLQNRLVLWVVAAVKLYNIGKTYAPPQLEAGQIQEPRYRWDRGPTEQGCVDCVALDGVILTASEWRSLGLEPQSADLACGGYNCLCKLTQVLEVSVGLEGVRV